MNWRWFLAIVVFALAFYGISKEKSTLPNQEIVVQFDAHSVNSAEARQAVTEITDRLKDIGVADVHVSELRNGKLKVTYYSTIDIALIKDLFSAEKKIEFNDTFPNQKKLPKTPFSDHSGAYKVVVFKIQKDYGADLGIHGFPLEIKTGKDQYFNQTFPHANLVFALTLKQSVESLAYKNYRNASLLVESSSHKIPEVRAGPFV